MPRLAAFPKGFFNDIVEGRMSVFRWIELAGGLGLEGAELYPGFLESFDSAYLARVRKAAEAWGLELPMMCNSSDFTRPDPADRARELERNRQVVRATAELGGGFCRVLSGQNRPGLDVDKAMDWVIDGITQLIPEAERAGIMLVIENHYKDGLWEYPEFAQRRDRFMHIVRTIDSPRFGVQYDPSNAVVAGDDPYTLLEEVLPRVMTMQASDRYLEGGTLEDLRRQDSDPKHGYANILRHGVTGRGLNDYDRIFRTLAGAGYDGWVSIEDGEAPTETEGLENLRESARFLQAQLAKHFK